MAVLKSGKGHVSSVWCCSEYLTLQQNSWLQPEQNWLVCFSPQQTHTLEAVCFSIQLKYTMTCQCVLNDFEPALRAMLTCQTFYFCISVWNCSQGEFGHLVLLAVFDCVDDTKLVKQAVLSVCLVQFEMLKRPEEIIKMPEVNLRPLAMRISNCHVSFSGDLVVSGWGHQ